MTQQIPNPSEGCLDLNRRDLLTSVVGVTAARVVGNGTPCEAAVLDPDQSHLTVADGLPLDISAATARRLAEISGRNEFRRESKLPPAVNSERTKANENGRI